MLLLLYLIIRIMGKMDRQLRHIKGKAEHRHSRFLHIISGTPLGQTMLYSSVDEQGAEKTIPRMLLLLYLILRLMDKMDGQLRHIRG